MQGFFGHKQNAVNGLKKTLTHKKKVAQTHVLAEPLNLTQQ